MKPKPTSNPAPSRHISSINPTQKQFPISSVPPIQISRNHVRARGKAGANARHAPREAGPVSSTTIKKTTTVEQNPSLPSLISWTRIRDHLVVNKRLQEKILSATVEGSTVTLIARVIQHQPFKFDLDLPRRHVRVIATEYNANGGSINVSPGAGSSGSSGANGLPGYADHNPAMNRPGSAGGRGGPGFPGTAATTIQLICERLHDVHLIANGGPGGPGGAGGTGGDGGNGVPQTPRHDGLEGTAGGAGGAAGPGGAGGKGGEVHVSFVSADNAQAIRVEANGGAPGAAGARGHGGKVGRFGADAPPGPSGAASPPGAAGAVGKADATQVAIAEYWSRAKALLGIN